MNFVRKCISEIHSQNHDKRTKTDRFCEIVSHAFTKSLPDATLLAEFLITKLMKPSCGPRIAGTKYKLNILSVYYLLIVQSVNRVTCQEKLG